jgi:hypothetical protein
MKIFEGMNAGKQRFSRIWPDLGRLAHRFRRDGRRRAAAAPAPYHRPTLARRDACLLRRAGFSPALCAGTLIYEQNGLQRLSNKRKQLLIT